MKAADFEELKRRVYSGERLHVCTFYYYSIGADAVLQNKEDEKGFYIRSSRTPWGWEYCTRWSFEHALN